ncbi:MAG: hypothetical protein ACR2GY_04240 [Phycisphaerales bacterium]
MMSGARFIMGCIVQRCRFPELFHIYDARVKTTAYFDSIRQRPDRAIIQDAWIERILASPNVSQHRIVQEDGRIRLWGRVPEFDDRFLRVSLLPDGETVHNAFFDRGFETP